MASSARLDELRKKFDENPRRYFAPLANEYRKAGETDQAIAICREYLPQQPGHMSGHIVFGQALYEARQFEEAKTVFETALSLDPENLIALRHLGDIALILGDTGAARVWYRRVLDADPRNEEIQGQLASLDKAASTAPTPAVSPAQTPAEPAPAVAQKPAAAKPTPSSAPTVVVQAMKPPVAAPAATVTATSPTAEVRLDEILPQAPAEPEPVAPAPRSLSAVPTLEVTTSTAAHEPSQAGESHAPVEGLESHAAAHEAPPLDSFSLEGLETTSLSHSAPPPQAAAPLPDLELGQAAAPAPVTVEPAPAPAPPADELQPLDLDFGGVARPPAEQHPDELAQATSPDLEFITPEAPVAAEATPAVPLPDFVPAAADHVPAPALEFEAPAAPAAVPPAVPAPSAEIAYDESPAEAVVPAAESGPFVTETMAELYLRQGHRDEALRVYHALIEQRPDDPSLREKVRRIEAMAAASMVAPSMEPGGIRFGDVLRMLAERRPGHRPEGVHTNGTAAAVEGRVEEPAADLGVEARLSSPEPAPAAPVTAPAASGVGVSAVRREDLLATALAFGPAGDADEQSAHALATAYATNGAAARLSGAPARPAASELSLDSVFGAGQTAPPPPPSSFSFDQFFANKDGTVGAPPASGPESAAEVAQFTQWLEGLKRR